MALLTALPWPVRLLFFALAGILAARLLQGLGWFLALVAILLWSIAGLVALQAARIGDGLPPLPALGPFLTWIGGGAFGASAVSAPHRQTTAAPAESNRERTFDEALEALGQLRGIPLVTEAINHLLDMAEDARDRGRQGLGTNAPAVVLALTGGPGTGKTTVARLLAPLFYGQKTLERPAIQNLSAQDLTGGSPQRAQQAAEAALGGILLLDDADWMCQSRSLGDTPGLDAAHAIMGVAGTHPGRLLIVLTLSKNAFQMLTNDPQHHMAWLGKLLVEEIAFPEALPESDLLSLLEEQLATHNLGIETEARPALQSQIKSLRHTPSPLFDNASAMRRLAERVRRQAQARIHREGGHDGRPCVTIADVRAITE